VTENGVENPTVTHDTFVLQRTLSKPPERAFRAFSDIAQKRRWYAEGERNVVEAFEMDFRVGGRERLVSRLGEDTPFKGVALTSEAIYLDIAPEQRIVIARAMTLGDRRISAALITFELKGATGGTTLTCTHQAAFFDGADGPRMREAGWRALLDQLESRFA
jgi:uncharacterized protein YndB with AHSA1/START domain